MHVEAREVLPALLAVAGIDAEENPPWMFGHSDGGSIALIYASESPQRIAGVIAAAPHIFVEDVTVQSIAQAVDAYRYGELASKLARYHDHVDSVFHGWTDIWLSPEFRMWNIEAVLPAIRCPVLAVQGYQDEYGTMAQIDQLSRHVPHANLLRLADCGHSAHRDQPDALIRASIDFITNRDTFRAGDDDRNRGGRVADCS
jgi:pimeloyl-ACP methyl ester carboxylesterase